MLVARALVVEDLLRVRAVDTTAPRLVLHFVVATLFALGHARPARRRAVVGHWSIALALCFAGVRTSIATIGLVSRGGRGGEGPLERLLDQLVVARATSLTSSPRSRSSRST